MYGTHCSLILDDVFVRRYFAVKYDLVSDPPVTVKCQCHSYVALELLEMFLGRLQERVND